MKKILFWSCGDKTFTGDISHIRLFYQQINSSHYDFYLASPTNLTDYYENYFKDTQIRILKFNDIFNFKFDIVIVAEYANFIKKMNLKPKDEKQAYYYILNLNIPVLAFDALERYEFFNLLFPWQDKAPDNCKKAIVSKFFPKGYDACLVNKLCIKKEFMNCRQCNPPDISIIYPCPPNTGLTNKPLTIKSYYWRLPFSEIEKKQRLFKKKYLLRKWLSCHAEFISASKIEILKQVQNDIKVIFLSISYNSFERLQKLGGESYFLILEKLLIHYLKQLSQKIHLIIVSPVPFYNSINIENIYINNILITAKNPLNLTDYEDLFLSSDLILTINKNQNTFWTALCNGIPGINLSFSGLDLNYELTVFTKELIPALTFNPPLEFNVAGSDTHAVYKNLFNTCEIFDERKFVKLIDKCLNDKNFKQQFIRTKNKYLKHLSGLPDAMDIIKSFEK